LENIRQGNKATYKETIRLGKLETIVTNLRRGENVQNRQLKAWLSPDEYEQIGAEWDTQKHFREELKDKPDQLKRFDDKLKEAIMMRNRLMLTIERVRNLQHISWTASAKAYVKMH